MQYKIDFKGEQINRVNYFIPKCTEHALASYGRTIGEDFLKAFCGEWNFEFEDKNTSEEFKIADCIKRNEVLIEEYQYYNGVDIHFKKVSSLNNLVKVIEENVKNELPTLIHMDTFYSYWGFLYNKVHSNHIAVALTVDKELKKLSIVDPDFSYQSFEVDFELVEKASTFYLDIKIEDINKYSYDDLLDILGEKKIEYEKQFIHIEKFAKCFGEKFDPFIEFDNNPDIDNVLNSRLISRIRNIIKGRNLFIVFLEQLVSKHSFIEKIIEYIYISIGKWNTIMNLLFKSARTKWTQEINEKVKKIILSIAEIEREAYQLLCGSRSLIKKKTKLNKIQNGNFHCVCIDLKSYCNNKGFVYEDLDTKNIDLTNAGEYIVLHQNYDVILYNKTRFKTYFINKNDNIICKGQIIDISNIQKIYSLELLICAEWGSCEDSIVINSKNGEKYTKRIIANDISEILAENTIVVGHSKSLDGNIVNEKIVITYNQIIIDKEQEIISFKLPINPNMHIIAVSTLIKTHYEEK